VKRGKGGIGVKLRRSIISELWISDSGIEQVEFFFNIFGVDRITWPSSNFVRYVNKVTRTSNDAQKQ
jgi:hypothetical protein